MVRARAAAVVRAAEAAEAAESRPTQVIVALSGGKDSLAVLDLCCKRFSRVAAYFMFTVRDLSFQESIIRWCEQHYSIEVLRVPHFELFNLTDSMRLTWFRESQEAIPRISPRDLEDYIRDRLGIEWIAGGEKKNDSMERRAMISASGPWDQKRKRYYAIADWTSTQVFSYLRANRIPVPAYYTVLGQSWRGMRGDQLYGQKPEENRTATV